MKYILILALSLAISELRAQSIITDRPDQTESAISLDRGQYQIESGTVWDSDNGRTTWTPITNLFRIGLFDGVEFRLVSGMETSKLGTERRTHVTNLEVGAKVQILEKGPVPIAIMGHMELPTGTQGSDYVGLFVSLLWSHDITDFIGVGYNFGYQYDTEGYEHLRYTLAVGFSLTEKLGFFMEGFGAYEEFEDWVFNYDNGFTYLIRNNLQADFSFGFDISEKTNFYSAGISWRLPE